MPARVLADFLTDFGQGTEKPVASPGAAVAPAVPRSAVQPPADIDALVAAQVAVAEARIRAEAVEQSEAGLLAERARYDQALAELHAEFGTDIGTKLSAAMRDAETRLTALTAGATARILSSVLSDDLAQRSVEQLAATIRAAVDDRDALRIRIVGPQSLFESLRRALGPLAAQCDFAEAPGFDLTVAIDGTLYETRLAEWSAAIGEAIF